MTDVHPLFIDRPELDTIAWEMMRILHSAVPEAERPTGWADFSEAQVLRAKAAALSVQKAADLEAWTQVIHAQNNLAQTLHKDFAFWSSPANSTYRAHVWSAYTQLVNAIRLARK